MSRKFTEAIQEHERVWHVGTYPDRPNLDQIMQAPVVAFWIQNNDHRPIITLHPDLKDIKSYFHTLARRLPIGYPSRRLSALFVNQCPVRVNLLVAFEAIETEAQE